MFCIRKATVVTLMSTITCLFAQTTDGGSVVSGLPNNALTTAEQNDGYQLLWNGQDFTGLLINNSTTNPSSPSSGSDWSIVTTTGLEGTSPHRSTNPDSNMLEVTNNGGYSLFTKDSSFQNFDWKLEWQAVVGIQGNSGMLIHYRVDVNTNNNYSAPEYQICNAEWSSEWKSLLTTAGNNYLMTPLLDSRKKTDLSPTWVRAEGHWNQSRIISYGARTAHYGNGLRLLEYQMLTPAWNTAYNASKYKGLGIYNTIHSGSFFIQNHGEKWMKFRNIRVKKLTQNPWASNSPYLNKDSAATGDSTLIDTLTFASDLYPVSTPVVSPYTIVPREATKITANDHGIAISFSQPGDYSISLEDVRGFRFSTYHITHADQFFIPAQLAHSPRILTVWKGNRKIRESVIGVQ